MHHVRACLWTTCQGRVTSPCKRPVCAAHAARSHRKSLRFIKRSIHRLAHTDLIRTVRERTGTRHGEEGEWLGAGHSDMSGGGGGKNRKPSRVKRNVLKPTAAWAEWTRVSLTTETGNDTRKGSESTVRRDNVLFPIIQATVPLIHSPAEKRSKIKPFSLVNCPY